MIGDQVKKKLLKNVLLLSSLSSSIGFETSVRQPNPPTMSGGITQTGGSLYLGDSASIKISLLFNLSSKIPSVEIKCPCCGALIASFSPIDEIMNLIDEA